MFIVLFRSFLAGLELNLHRHVLSQKNVSITLSLTILTLAVVVSFIKSPTSGSSDLIYSNWKSRKTTYKNYNNIMMKKLIEKKINLS